MQFLHYAVVGLFQDSWLTFGSLLCRGHFHRSRLFRKRDSVPRFPNSKNLILALGKAMTKLFAIAMLMVLVFYVFGVMFTQLFHTAYADGVTDTDYFSSLHQTFFTLFQLTTLDSWSLITRDLMTVYPWAWMPMFCFVMVSSFIVIILVIAVICDAVAGMQHEEHEVVIKRMESIVEHQTKPGYATTAREIAQLEAKIDLQSNKSIH